MIDIIAIIMIVCGLIFFLGAVIGLTRFPDFYTRMHAAGKGDTLSTILILGGLALKVAQGGSIGELLVALKIIGIVIFIFITSPTSTHALMQAGYDLGFKPFRKNLSKDHDESQRKEELL